MRTVASATVLGAIVAALGSTFLQADSTTTTSQTQTRILESYGRLPLHFERNDGQVDSSVRFLARGSGYSLFLKPTEAVLALRQRETANAAVLRFTLEGGNRRPAVAGRNELPGRINYFVGNDPAAWRTNIATYARVYYSDVYPGIDLVYYGNQQQLEYDFVVAPGADPRRIRMVFDGARDVSINADGDLILSVAGGELRQRKPIVYQDVKGVREPIIGRYVMRDGRQIGFELGAYDRSRPLVIDPVLVYSTYLGGSARDGGNDIAVDAQGNAYVGGETSSADFPTASAAYASLNGGIDGFVTKLNPTGSALIYSTYLGSAAEDRVNGIAVDALGSAYVTGETNPLTNPLNPPFPTTTGAFDTTANGALDAFVAKLDPTGATLIYSTYLGGLSADRGNGIALDAEGNAYVTGQTFGSTFPTTPDAFDRVHDGIDAFVTKVNAAGSDLVYSTYLGGGSTDSGNDIAVDAAGHAYVTGQTASLAPPFPTTPLAFDSSLGGVDDAFVTKLSETGSALEYSTYLGGGSTEVGNGIAIDGAGNAYVTGETSSDVFPTTAGALDVSRGGITDAFVTKLNPTGSALAYSTYLGGTSGEIGTDIAVDGFSNAHVTGSTSSLNFPTSSDAVQSSPGGLGDAFVTRLDAAGAALIYSTYLGGNRADSANGIVVDARAHAYVTGMTQSANFPTTAAAFDTDGSTIGASEAFVAKIGGGVPASLTLDPPSDTNIVGTSHCVMATVADVWGNPVPETMVRFTVMGAVNTSGTGTTDTSGQTEFCYDGPTVTGLDAISAFVDTDTDGIQDEGEPGGGADKTWVPGAPASLTLTPPVATNPVGMPHCIMAAASDAFGNPTPGVPVSFSVTGAVNTTGSATTDTTGQARFCYDGPTVPGSDAIAAFADTDADGTQDADEPGGQAAKTWVAGPPAALTVTPSAATNPVGTQHCVVATVRDAFGNPTPGVSVNFSVTGAVNTTGSATTDTTGQAGFCYDGPAAPGGDAIAAFADTDADGTQDAGEPGGGAQKTWVLAAPGTLALTPAVATNPVGTEHCVTAAVSDAFGNRTPGITVRFSVTGAVTTSGTGTTDAAGQAGFCYDGPTAPGGDAIAAFADTDTDGTQDAGEPGSGAEKTWVPAAPATLTLTPAVATNPVGTEHCVTAAVSDAFGNRTPGITVRFSVTGAVNTSGTGTTDTAGQAGFCYDGPTTPGGDAISAFADTDTDGMRDADEPGGQAAKTWVSGSPAALTLTPPAATTPVGTEHCVVATVSDAFGNPTPDIVVRFFVTGAVNTTGSAPTDAAGRAGFCYTGPLVPGSDLITAYADTDADQVRDPGEPGGSAANTWTASTGTTSCTVAGGGYITTSSGSRATFGGVARWADGVARGIQAYVDHGSETATKMTVISQTVDSVDCYGAAATILGRATVRDYGTVMYRIDVTDGTYDTYSIQLSNGYASGTQVVFGGNIKIF